MIEDQGEVAIMLEVDENGELKRDCLSYMVPEKEYDDYLRTCLNDEEVRYQSVS